MFLKQFCRVYKRILNEFQSNSNLETCDTKILVAFAYKFLPYDLLRDKDSGSVILEIGD